jgi:carboxymethylenebutenolidase
MSRAAPERLAAPLPTHFDSLVPALRLPRRAFMLGTAGAGFALAAQPICAQTAIHTDSVGLVTGEARVPHAAGDVPVYFARPAQGGPRAVVLVISEVFGVHEYIADTCRRLAHAGYLAIAPELFARYGEPRKIDSVQQILADIVARTPDAEVMSDLDACVRWAQAQGGDTQRLAITGFCWGGRIAWLYAAHNPALKAAVAWYGSLDGAINPRTPKSPLDLAGELKAPVLGLYGGADQGISQDDVEAMRDAIRQAGGRSELHVYPDAPHAFHADYRPSYRAAEALDGWKRMLAWLSSHGVRP